jgi:hypothetical protein
MDVIEDLADELWIGDIGNDTKPPAAERAECDIDFEHTLQALRPGQRRGGRGGRGG